jgi:hypothetical protein
MSSNNRHKVNRDSFINLFFDEKAYLLAFNKYRQKQIQYWRENQESEPRMPLPYEYFVYQPTTGNLHLKK